LCGYPIPKGSIFMARTNKFYLAALALSVWAAILLPISARAQAQLRLVGQLDPFPGNNRYADVWAEGRYAYLGSYFSDDPNDGGGGLMIIDIANPAAPQLVGHYNPSQGGRFQDVIVINGIGYFSSENRGGVHIVDVRNPAQPILLSQINTEQNGFPNVHELFVADGVLYEADARTNVVKVFDVRNPRQPVFLRNITTTDTRIIHAITVINGRLYTSGFGGKTDIYDVRDVLTTAPILLGAIDSGTSSHTSWVSSDGRLLVSAREASDGNVRLFDISNPASPLPLATITKQSLGIEGFTPHNPFIVGNLLFVSWYQAGVVVIDITDPRQPRLTGVYDTLPANGGLFNGCWGVFPFLGFDKILLSDMNDGLIIVDATAALAGPRTVSAASYNVSAIAPRAIVTAFGNDLALVTQAATTLPLPTTLGGVAVQVQDSAGQMRPAPLFFVSPAQINYQIPAGTAAGPATVFVTSNGVSKIGATIIAPSAPALFTQNQSGAGAGVALDAFTFTAGPFNATRATGEPNIIAVFLTGLGDDATDSSGNVSQSVVATLDEQPVTVTYAGRAPGFAGLNQLNLVLPAGITSGEHRLFVTRNGVTSNAVTLSIR
jgi:uncharacterized protein (TIGR03437 family)